MGIAKIPGKYVEQMTEPGGWPHFDEQTLIDRGVELTRMLQQLNSVLLDWLREEAEIFGGNLWSGGAATAAEGAVRQEIAAMRNMQDSLVKTISWYAVAVHLIAATKTTINFRLVLQP